MTPAQESIKDIPAYGVSCGLIVLPNLADIATFAGQISMILGVLIGAVTLAHRLLLLCRDTKPKKRVRLK